MVAIKSPLHKIATLIGIAHLGIGCFATAWGQVALTIGASPTAYTCDTVVFTNGFVNLGTTLDGLVITNTLATGTRYVTNRTVITLPSGQVLTGSAAEPTSNLGGTNLVWDFSGLTTDSGISHLLISEVFYDPTGAGEESNEWVEIYNPTADAISIAGYSLGDALPGQYDLLPTVSVQPGQFIVVAASTTAFYLAHGGYTGVVIGVADETLGSSLNNFGDGVFLRDASSNLVDAVSYGGSSAAFNPGATAVSEGSSLVRNPANADNNNRNDWTSGSPSPGSGTVLTGVSPGAELTIRFMAELSCSAQTAYFRSGARYQQPAGGSTLYANTAWNLSLQVPNLTLTKRPSVQYGGFGDTVIWTVRVENAGYGQADNVTLRDTRGPGIRFKGFSIAPTNGTPYQDLTSVVWNASVIAGLASMDPGATVSVVVTGEIVACTGLYNNVLVQNGCTGLTMFADQVCYDSSVGGNEGGSIEFLYRYALVSGSVAPGEDFTLPYCDGRDITLYLTNAPGSQVGTALNIQLEPVLPAGYTVSGAHYVTNSNRIVVGDLAPGQSTGLTLRLRAGGSCPLETARQLLTFRPTYTDACGTPYTTPPLNAYSTLSNEPSAQITKIIPSVSGAASSLTVRVLFNYQNFNNTPVSFADQLPSSSYWSITNVTGGGVTTSATVVRWNKTFSGSGVFTGTFDLVWTDTCNVGGGYVNTVTASNYTDCAGCPRTVTGNGELYYFTITAYNCPTGSPTTGTCSFAVAMIQPSLAEVCETLSFTTRVSNLRDATTSSWSGVLFSNSLAGGQARLTGADSIRLMIDGTDYTPYLYLAQTSPALRITFTNLNSSAIPRPGLATNLELSWRATVTNPGQYAVNSIFTLPGCSTRSGSAGLNVGAGTLGLELGSLVGQDACGVSYGRIDLEQGVRPLISALTNHTFPVYDAEVVLDLDANRNGSASYRYQGYSTTFSNFFAASGTTLPSAEPVSITATQLVWSLGDLRTNGAGSIHFRLQGSCTTESGEKLRAYVRFNERCEDGLAPVRSAYSSTNTLPTLYTATLAGNLEPEVGYLPGTTYVFRVELFNSGAGAAYNVSAEVAKPSNIAFLSAGFAPSTSSATNLVWTFQVADAPGGLADMDGDGFEDDLPPNASLSIYVTNYITACDPTTIRLTTRSGCRDSYCQTATDSSYFIPSSPSLNAATAFPNQHNLCATGTVSLAIRNSGAGRAYDVLASHVIPFGVSYVTGSARLSVDGGTTNSLADPAGTGTSANPLRWDAGAVAAFSDMAPNQEVRILYDVYLACDSVRSGQTYQARTTYRDNCGYIRTNDVSSGTVVPGTPVLSITKLSRNATLGQGSFTSSTIPGNPGDVVVYQITVDHTVASQNDLLAMKVTDLLPDSVTYVSAAPTPSSISGRTLIWSNNTLMTLVGGPPYLRSASSFSLYVTGVVASCTANVQNVSWIEYGCQESCLSLAATSRVYHTFTPALSSSINASDGLILNEAGGRLNVTLQNSGGAAVSLVVTQAAPSGYLITGASVTGEFTGSSLTINLTGSPAGQTGIINFASTATSGATDQDDDLADGLSALDLGYGNSITIQFTLISDGTALDCAADPRDYNFSDPDPGEPVSVTARFAAGSRDACGQPQVNQVSVSSVPLRPDPDIDLQPNELLVTNNQVVTFTLTVKNRGEQGNASNLHVRARLGSGWSEVAILGTSVVQSASGTVQTELLGSSNLLVSLPGVVLDPLDDQVVLTLQGRARQGYGSLDIVGEVVGHLVNPAIPATCSPTNTWNEPPMAATVTGTLINTVSGRYYSFDQDRTRVAGFAVKKTVRYAGEPAPGVTNLTARIGEDLIYRIESQVFGITISNLTITESLPANLVFGTPIDAGSTANISNLWTFQRSSGIFTLPTPLAQDALFVVDIPVVVSNAALNQGESPTPTVFTNAATPDFDTDGITNPPPSSLTQVLVLEANLALQKTCSAGTSPVQAGELVIFTNRISHTAASLTNAYDLVMRDDLPAGLTFAGLDLGADGLDNDADGVADGADAADEASLVSGNQFTVTTNNSTTLSILRPGETRSILIPAYVLNQTLGGQIINTGRVTWTSLPGDSTNLNERVGLTGINDYVATGTAALTSRPVAGITKTLVATSEAGTVDPRVTIGERLVYRIHVDFPAGSAYNVSIVDNVATGMDFVGSNPAAGLAYPGTGYSFFVPDGGPRFPTNPAQGLVVTDPDASPASSVDVAGSGKAITFNLGGITNAPDGNPANDYFELNLEYIVLNQATNNGLGNPAWSNVNRATYADALQSLTATSAFYVIGEPDVRISKRRSPTTGMLDAGDVVTIALVASNLVTATARAYDFVVTDTLSNRFWDLDSITLVEEAAGWSYSAITNTASVQVRFTSNPGTYLAPGQQVTNRFSIAAAQVGSANQIYTNRADIAIADTLDGTPPTGTTGRTDTANSSILFSNRNFALTKTLAGTSENGPVDSTTTNVQVGEGLVYALRLTIPEGTYTNLAVTDLLPPGLSYVFGSASNDLSGFNGSLATLTESPSGSGLADPGVDPVFTYAGTTVVTADNDTNNNAITLYLTAVVRDTNTVSGLNGSTTFLTNQATVTYSGNSKPAQTSGVVVARVIEPNLAIFKDIVQTNADAGDTVIIDLVVTNSGTASAYDLEIQDSLDIFPALAASVTPLLVPAGFAVTVSNQAVHIQSASGMSPPDNSLEPGESISIRFQANLSDQVPPLTVLTNRAVIAQGDTIRGTPAYGVQRFAGGAYAEDTLLSGTVGISKEMLATSETGLADSTNDLVQIGEQVTYRLTIALPEGTVSNLTVMDILPPGLAYVHNSASVEGGGFNGTLPDLQVTPAGSGLAADGADITLSWPGATVVTGDNQADNNAFRVNLAAVVTDLPGNQGLSGSQTRLTNTAVLTLSGTSLAFTTTPVVVRVVEPLVSIGKTFSTPTGDAGDPVTVTLILTNTGLAAAYDLVVQDPLDTRYFDGTRFATGAVPAGYSMAITGAPSPVVRIQALASGAPTNTLEPRESLRFTFTSYLAQAVMPSQVASNRATVLTADSIAGTPVSGVQRSAAGASAYATLSISNISVSKRLLSTSATGVTDTTGTNLTVGEIGTYAITVDLPEGTISNLVVTDVVPDGLQFVPGSAQVITTGFAGQLPGEPTITGGTSSGDDILFTFLGGTVVSNDNLTGNNAFELRLQARVLDVPAVDGLGPAVDGDEASWLTNRAVVSCVGCGGLSLTSTPTVIGIQEPWAAVGKSVTSLTGTWFRTTLWVTNRGSSTAYDVQVQDLFPTDVWNTATLNAGTLNGYTVTWSNTDAGRWLSLASAAGSSPPANSLEPGEGISLVITGSVWDGFTATAVNTATVTRFTTLSGEVSGERDEPEQSATAPFGAPDVVAYLRAIDLGGLPLIGGDTIHYRLLLTNAGGASATSVRAVVLIPTNTTPVSGSMTNRGQVVPVTSYQFPVDVGTLAAGETATITYMVTVNNGLPLSVTSIFNLATATWNESIRTEVSDNDTTGHATLGDDGIDSPTDAGTATEDDDPTILYLTSVSFEVTKTRVTPQVRPAHIGEPVQFLITITNSGGVRLSSVQVQDSYETTYLTYLKATPAPADAVNDGQLTWSNLGSLNPGSATQIVVYFTGKAATSNPRQNSVTASATVQNPYPNPEPKNASADYEVSGTTYASLHTVEGWSEGGTVKLAWETASEVGSVGFYVWRLNQDPAARTLVTPDLVPAWNAAQGGRYVVCDPGAEAGRSYTYVIEEVEDHGAVLPHGPFPVTIRKTTRAQASAPAAAPHPGHAFRSTAPQLRVADNSGYDRARLRVNQEGLYALSATQLAEAWARAPGEVLDLIAHDAVEVRHRGTRVPCYADGNRVLFYAPAWQDRYSAHDVYEILPGRNLRLAAPRPTSAATAADTVSEHVIRIESNRTAVMTLVFDEQQDYWVWEQLIAGQANADRRSFNLNVPDPTGTGSSRLKVSLLGGSNTDASPDHRVEVRLNGTTVGETTWEGRLPHQAEWTLPATGLRAGSNTVEIQAYKPTGVSYSVLYVDYLELTYARLPQLREGSLGLLGQGRAMTVSGLTTARVWVLDVADPRAPRAISWYQRTSNQLDLPATEPGHRYWICQEAGIRTGSVTGARLNHALASPTNACDYLILAPASFAAPAATLAQARATGRGWETRVVHLEDLYAVFGQGLDQPAAIRDFLRYIHHHWTRAPRYVVLAGDGTYDYADQLGYHDTVLPPALVTTPNGLFASDTPYADIDQDGRLDFAVGRLPARSAGELDAMINKIMTYESATGTWTRAGLLMADNADAGGAFDQESDQISQLLTGRYSLAKAYLGTSNLVAVRTLTLSSWQAGLSFVNYVGHGALDRLAQEGLLVNTDLTNLNNGARCPLVVSMTCVVGRYSVPGSPCLGEELLRKPGGGAIAVLSPIGLSSPSLSVPLNQAVVRALGAGSAPLGEIWLRASSDFFDGGGDAIALTIFNLLGDPGLIVK